MAGGVLLNDEAERSLARGSRFVSRRLTSLLEIALPPVFGEELARGSALSARHSRDQAVFRFFGRAEDLLEAATVFFLARTTPFLPLPSSRLARRRDIKSRTPLSCVSWGVSSFGFFPFIFALM